jgi:hypothetical protein
MKRLFVPAVLLASAVALAKDAPARQPAPQAGPTKTASPELDVSRMPFTPDSIQQVIQHHTKQIQGCYEDHLAAKNKKVEGRLMTTFTITPDGLVKNAKVLKKGTTLHDAGLHDCVVAVLTSLTFPKPPDERDHPIEYPFNLKAIE